LFIYTGADSSAAHNSCVCYPDLPPIIVPQQEFSSHNNHHQSTTTIDSAATEITAISDNSEVRDISDDFEDLSQTSFNSNTSPTSDTNSSPTFQRNLSTLPVSLNGNECFFSSHSNVLNGGSGSNSAMPSVTNNANGKFLNCLLI